jgi:glutaredoxin
MNSPLLELYYFESCPFCIRVVDTIKRLNLKVTYVDIHEDPQALAKLISDRGRKTVPVLYIDGTPKPESQDIINWLVENIDKCEKNS